MQAVAVTFIIPVVTAQRVQLDPPAGYYISHVQ
jgi:hypothetical protein